MAVDLAIEARERGIKYFLISFVDLFGTLRAKLAPASAIADMAKEGAGFAGFASWLDMTPAHPDMLAIPDPDSLIQIPWKPEVGWLAADPYMDGKLVDQCADQRLDRRRVWPYQHLFHCLAKRPIDLLHGGRQVAKKAARVVVQLVEGEPGDRLV